MQDAFARSALRSPVAETIGRLAASSRSPVDSPDRLQEAAGQVADRLAAAGCRVETDPVSFRGRHFDNVLATRPGRREGPALIVAAHHDSAPHSTDPGGLMGLAVLLETASTSTEFTPETPLVFASYTLRNWGMAGSGHHVARLGIAPNRILGAIHLESVGGRQADSGPLRRGPLAWRRPAPLRLVGNFASRRLLRATTRGLREAGFGPFGVMQIPGRGFLLPEAREGDHASFWDAGLPAVMLADRGRDAGPAGAPQAAALEPTDLAAVPSLAAALGQVIRNILSRNALVPSSSFDAGRRG